MENRTMYDSGRTEFTKYVKISKNKLLYQIDYQTIMVFIIIVH